MARLWRPETLATTLAKRAVEKIGVLSWNCFTLRDAYRVEDVGLAFKGVHVCGLQGTKLKAQPDAPHTLQKTKTHMFIHWGFKASMHSNFSAGVSLALHRRFSAKHVKQVGQPPASLQLDGRGGFCEIKQGMLHIFPIVLYYPPRPGQSGNATRRWLATCARLRGWLDSVLDAVPVDATPIILEDENSDKGLRGKQRVIDETVGDKQTGQENTNGRLCHDLAVKHGMAYVNSFYDVGPTFFNMGKKSRIDWVLTPASLLFKIISCEVWHRATKKVQANEAFIDHVAVVVFLDIPPPHRSPPPAAQRWDHDALAACSNFGVGREAFLADFEKELDAAQGLFEIAARDATPDRHMQLLVECATRAGLRHFSLKARKPPWFEEATKERLRLLAERRAAKLNGDVSQRQGANCVLIRALSSRLRAFRKADRLRWNEHFENEIREAHKNRDTSRTHRLCRLRAGTKRGTKKRDYRALPSAQPGVNEYIDFYKKEGDQGGISACVVEPVAFVIPGARPLCDYTAEEFRADQTIDDNNGFTDGDDIRLAKQDFFDVRKKFAGETRESFRHRGRSQGQSGLAFCAPLKRANL